MNLSRFATQNLKAILFVTLVLCGVGAWLVGSFPVGILPDVTFPRIKVVVDAGDRPSRIVEIGITRPIEEAIATVPGVTRVISKTQRGATEISIDFNWSTDMLISQQLVNNKINEIRSNLPLDTHISVERMNPTVFPVYGLSLNSKGLSPAQLWSIANYRLKPRLARVTGVARVEIQGGRVPEIAVEVDPRKLAAYRLSLSDVSQSISQSNVIRAVGRLNQQFQTVDILVSGEKVDAEALGNVVVTQRSGIPVILKQLAKIGPSMQDQTTIETANGEESVLLNIVRQPDANSVTVIEGVKKELIALKRTLPPGTQIGTFYDQSLLIREAVSSVEEAVIIGGILAVVVLMIFLGDIRATIVTASIIPITVLITFLLMRLFGMTLNLMTLGALAIGIGLVIDDAIVVVENVFRHLSHGASREFAVQSAANEIAAPMISSTLTTVVVFLPLSLLSGVAGAFFTALAVTLTIALLVSLILALLVSPSLCAAFLKVKQRRKAQLKSKPSSPIDDIETDIDSTQSAYDIESTDPESTKERIAEHEEDISEEHGAVFGWIIRFYGSTLRLGLRFKWFLPVAVLVLMGSTYYFSRQLGTGFMPTMDEGAFVLDFWTPPGTSLAESDRLLKHVEEILKSTPEVESYSRRTGTELGFAVTEPNRGDFAIMLKPNRKRGVEEIISDVRKQITAEVPGVDVNFSQILQDLINDLSGSPKEVEIKLFGENPDQLNDLARKLVEQLKTVKGTADRTSGVVESGPELVAKVDPLKAGRAGLTPDMVAGQANTALFGDVVTQLLVGDKQIGVRVRYPISGRRNRQQMELLPIRAPGGFNLPLSSLANIETVPGTTEINREDQRRLVDVSSHLEDRDLGSVMGDVKALMDHTPLPPGVTYQFGGVYQSQTESFRNLVAVLGLAMLLVFAVMVFQFRSFTAPIVIMLVMPLSLFGVTLGLMITHTAINVSSAMGAVMLVGIVVKNGILLLDQAQKAESEGMPIKEAIVYAGQVRLRPILMTTLTAILGLVPLALGLGAGAEMQKPLAIAVIGGLSFSTIFTLLFGPILYVMLKRK